MKAINFIANGSIFPVVCRNIKPKYLKNQAFDFGILWLSKCEKKQNYQYKFTNC